MLGLMTEQDRRTTMVQIARSTVGIKYHTQLYNDVLYFGDKPENQKLMAAAQSPCSLLVAGLMRMAGERHPLITTPYVGRNDAHSRIEQVARDDGAWGGHDGPFEPGDFLMIGTDVPVDMLGRAKIIMKWGTPGHALTVLDVDGDKLTSLDGNRGRFEIKQRRIDRVRDQVWIVDEMGRRRVWGSILTGKLKFDPEAEWCLPKGPNYPGLS